MAKGKHAAALFEVIQGKKGTGSHAAESLRTPKWWFKGRPTSGAACAVSAPPADSTGSGMRIGSVAPSIGAAAPRLAALESPSQPAPIESLPESPHRDEAIHETIARHDNAARHRADPTRVRLERTAAGSVQMDRETRAVHIHVGYKTAMLAGFAVLACVAIAYVAGRRVGSGPDGASAAGIEDSDASTGTNASTNSKATPRGRSAIPAVLNVPRRGTRTATGGGSARQSAGAGHAPVHETAQESPQANSVNGLAVVPPAAAAAAPGPRVVGLNYIIAQSYPDLKTAREACDFLVRSGIPCTVESGPVGWAQSTWYSVVTTRGFEHIHTPECEAAQKAIVRANERFAGTAKFKRFEPHLYSWK